MTTDQERTRKMLRIRDAITADPLRAQSRLARFILGCVLLGVTIGAVTVAFIWAVVA